VKASSADQHTMHDPTLAMHVLHKKVTAEPGEPTAGYWLL